jgi:hypothetical protein
METETGTTPEFNRFPFVLTRPEYTPAAFEAIAFCELLMRSVKKNSWRARTVLRRSGVKDHRLLHIASRFRKNRNANCFATSVESNE